MATGLLPGQRYSPESPPTPGETGFESKLVEYLKREYGRIADALIGASVFNFEPQFVAIPGAQVPKTNEGDVAYADGTSWNPGQGEGLYVRINGAWVKLNIDRESKWEYIGLATPSGATSVDFIGLSAFRTLRIHGRVVPSTDSVGIGLRTDANNGASFDAGASDYDYAGHLGGEGATSTFFSNGDTEFQFNATAAGNTAAQEGYSFDFNIYDFNQAAYALIQGITMTVRDNNRPYYVLQVGRRLQATARDAVQILSTSGNIASGYVFLEGIRGQA